MLKLTLAGLSILFTAFVASAQITLGGNCSGRVFGASEVTKRARILKRPNLDSIQRRGPVRGRLVIEAVLCRSGHVTDIRVLEGISPEIDEFARAAVYMVKFEPAEYRWHSVSQKIKFEMQFGKTEPGLQDSTTDSAGRLVERVDIIGHRRLTTEQILSWIQTRAGESYSEEKIKSDFNALLATGNFDKTQTRVTVEDGLRGGIVVVFEVVELPVIGTVEFKGLTVDREIVTRLLEVERVDVQPGALYRAEVVKHAALLIKWLLDNSVRESKVETEIEQVTAQKVNLTFVITPNR